MATIIETDFLKYLNSISAEMVDTESVFASQLKQIEEQKLKFGLTNEQYAEAITKIHVAASQFITQYANSSAMELVKLELNQPLLEAEIALKEKDLELKEKDLELKDKDLELKDKELDIKEQELLILQKELEIKEEELKLMYAKIDEIDQKILLMKQQVITETKQQTFIIAQTGLVNRQTTGYSDNLYVKAGEFQGSLASFAVNSGSDSAQSAINEFLTTIQQIKARAK